MYVCNAQFQRRLYTVAYSQPISTLHKINIGVLLIPVVHMDVGTSIHKLTNQLLNILTLHGHQPVTQPVTLFCPHSVHSPYLVYASEDVGWPGNLLCLPYCHHCTPHCSRVNVVVVEGGVGRYVCTTVSSCNSSLPKESWKALAS